MKTNLLLLLLFALCSCTNSEWTAMFNGEDFEGWEVIDGTAEYRIENGEIVGTSKYGTPNTFLATKKSYGDFILEYEMKMDFTLNSGVQFRSLRTLADGTERVNGYQVECDDSEDRRWTGGIFDEARRKWLYPLSYNLPARDTYKRGEWNHFRIEAVGKVIRTFVNGVSVSNLVDDLTAEGLIGLQIHGIGSRKEKEGKEIRWRNVRIITENPQVYMKTDVNLAPEVNYLTNVLTENEKQEGWRLLWDGETTNGWRGAKLDKFPEVGWNIKDGILSVDRGDGSESTNGGDIVTTKKYESFIIEVDFILTEGANSGVKYFVNTELNKGEGSSIGCEFQILDDKKHPDAKKGIDGNRTLGSLYDLITADALEFGEDNKTKRFNGIESWNRARIEVRGNQVIHSLNGIKVVEYERSNEAWRDLVATSKYKVWPNFGEVKQGHILLQDHGDKVGFRNIKILELK